MHLSSNSYTTYCIIIHKKFIDIPTPDLYHESMASDKGEGVIIMTLNSDMMFGYRCANCWFTWGQPEVAGRQAANFMLAGYSSKFARGFALRTAQG